MFFNTWLFAVFAVIVVAVYAVAPARLRAYVLVLAGLAFYANAGPLNLLLIVAATFATYGCARLLQATSDGSRRFVLAGAAVVALVLILCYFKYARWLSAAFAAVVPQWHVPVVGPLIAPLAISFFTFEFIHFVVEVRAGRIKEFSLKQFLVFALFFPTMVAGPIKRYRTFAPQIDGLRMAQGAELQTALYRIVSGLFKKIAIADPVMVFALPIFHPDPSYTAGTYLVAMVAGSIKVYYDLSGYSDIAIGFGLLFGLRVPENFSQPYRATNVLDFWQRWHMSLTSWVRDYVFVPLATQWRGGRGRVAGVRLSVLVCMFAVMVVIGVWHGAGWQFVIWGVWNGGCMAVYQLWRGGVSRRIAWLRTPSPLLSILGGGLTWASFTFGLGWVAAPTIGAALSIYRTFL
jgi:alginate O-acetyltransferase complex protein AlgI